MEQLDSQPEKLDSRWFGRLVEAQVTVYKQFDGEAEERKRQKEAFLSDEVRNPTLDYPALETLDLDEREQSLLDLKEDILALETNEVVQKIYRAKINEAIAELRLLRAAKNGDSLRFARYNDFVNSRPDAINTAHAVRALQETVATKAVGDDPLRAAAWQRITAQLGRFTMPPADTMQEAPSVEAAPYQGRVTSIEEVATFFRAALVEEGLDDWAVAIDTEKGITAIRTDQDTKTIVLPTFENLSPAFKRLVRLAAVAAHEGMHAKRRNAGERSELHLLGIGLDRYEKGEEGVATYAEQQVAGADDFAQPERYFAIALATGAVDGEKRDFRDTFNVLKDYYLVKLKAGDDLEARADRMAWNLSVRIFRGTTSAEPGIVYSKDLAYFAGNRETWDLVNKNSDVVQTFTLGKFDAANERHVTWVLEMKYGITEGDLDTLAAATGSAT